MSDIYIKRFSVLSQTKQNKTKVVKKKQPKLLMQQSALKKCEILFAFFLSASIMINESVFAEVDGEH